MIDEDITYADKGYYSADLKPNSHKEVWAICEDPNCKVEGGRGRWVTFQQYRKICADCSRSRSGWFHTEATKKLMSDLQIGKKFSKEHCENISKSRPDLSGDKNPMYGKKHTLDSIEKMRDSRSGMLVGKDNGRWEGGTSFGDYCPKFNEDKKQEIRDKYNNCDYMSGIPNYICIKGGYSLCIHHVDYNKQQGCDDHEWRLIPLSRRNHAYTNANRPFWNNIFTYSLQYDEEYYREEDKNFDVFSYINEHNNNIIIGVN